MPHPSELDPDTQFTVYSKKLQTMKDRMTMLNNEVKKAHLSSKMSKEDRDARLAQLQGKIDFTNQKIAEYQGIVDANVSDAKTFAQNGLTP